MQNGGRCEPQASRKMSWSRESRGGEMFVFLLVVLLGGGVFCFFFLMVFRWAQFFWWFCWGRLLISFC